MSAIILNNQNLLFESFCQKNNIDNKIISAKISDCPLKLKVATLPSTQEKGYMHYQDPPTEEEGILFVYDYPKKLCFWMKNVNFDLDIIFFNNKLEYIKHITMPKCDNMLDHEIPRYYCDGAQYAAEVQSGWFNKFGNKNCKLEF